MLSDKLKNVWYTAIMTDEDVKDDDDLSKAKRLVLP